MPKTTSKTKNKMKEVNPETVTTGYCSSTGNIAMDGGLWSTTITGTDTFISNGSNTTDWLISSDSSHVKKKAVENIVDGRIELDSLLCNNETEVYEIEEIAFKEKKATITCEREVDLSYVEGLKEKSILLLEFSPVQVDDYKKRAIEHYEGKVLVTGTGTLTTTTGAPFTFTYTPYTTYGTTTISTNPNYFLTTGNISYA